MKPASQFDYITPPTSLVKVCFDGTDFDLPRGGNLAASLLAAGVSTLRQSPVSGAPRAPFCMMGACFECLVEIDGVTRQACMVEVCEGLDVKMLRRPGGQGDEND